MMALDEKLRYQQSYYISSWGEHECLLQIKGGLFVEIFHSKPLMSFSVLEVKWRGSQGSETAGAQTCWDFTRQVITLTCWWRYVTSQDINMRIHDLGPLNICAKFYGAKMNVCGRGSAACGLDWDRLILLFFVHFRSYFPQQVGRPPLLLLSEKGCRDFPAQPSGVNLQEHQRVAHQPETSQQECDSRVRSWRCHITEGRLGVEGPLIISVEVHELVCDTETWDDTRSREEPLNLIRRLTRKRKTHQNTAGTLKPRRWKAGALIYLITDAYAGSCGWKIQ